MYNNDMAKLRDSSGVFLPRTLPDNQIIIDAFQSGKNITFLRKKYGVSYYTIRAILENAGITIEDKKRAVGPKSAKWKGCGKLSASYFSGIKHGAINRKIEFNITIEDMWNKFIEQDGKCALSGIILVLEHTNISFRKSRNSHTASLDRIDSSKGYTIDNIQWVHKTVNRMKMDMSTEEFLDFCSKITSHAKSR